MSLLRRTEENPSPAASKKKKAGVDENSLAKIERGESRPKGLTLVKIIKALGVKSSDILPV